MTPRGPLGHRLASLTRRVVRGRAPPPPSAAETFDLTAIEATRPPFRAVERLRAGGPVHYLPRNECWIVIGYEEVRAALAAPRLFSSRPLAEVDPVLLGADPPEHAAVRRVVAAYLAAASLPRIAEEVSELAGTLAGDRFDLVAGYSVPIARKATALVLGLDDGDIEAIRAAPDLSAAPGEMLAASRDRLRRAALYRRLMSDGEGLIDDGQACSLVRLLCRAAAETTERLIVRGSLLALQDESLRRAMESDPALIAPFIDEAMRLYPPEPSLVRATTQETELGGVSLPAGAPVLLSLLGANRDPAVFRDAAEVKLDRARTQHVAFGGGVHQCVGAGIARRVALAALRTLLDPVRPIRASDPLDTVTFVVDQGIETPQRLMLGA